MRRLHLFLVLGILACGSSYKAPLTLDPGGSLPGSGSGGHGGKGGSGASGGSGGAGGDAGSGGTSGTCGILSDPCSSCIQQGCRDALDRCLFDDTCAAAWSTFRSCACPAERDSDAVALTACETDFNQSSATGSQLEICVTVCTECTR